MKNVGKPKTTGIRVQDLTPEQRERVREYRRQKALRQAQAEKKKAEQKKRDAKEKKLVIAGFVVSLLALLMMLLTFIAKWSWLPFVGVGLGIIDLILLVPLIVKSAKRKKLPVQSGLFLVSCILMTIGLVTNVILSIVQLARPAETQQSEQKLEEVDVNGMTISTACQAVRDKNWNVSEVIDQNNNANKSDCSDVTHKVSSYHYYIKGGSSSGGKVVLYFIGETQGAGNVSSEADPQASEVERIDQNFRSQMDEYEQFVDQYVAVIKAKNASPTDEALIEQYNSMTTQYNEKVAKINQIDVGKLSAPDREYYNTVVTRANQKIAEAEASKS